MHGMRVMMLALASSMMVFSGVAVARAVPRLDGSAAVRSELLGGSLLAIGLMLIGIGLHSSFG